MHGNSNIKTHRHSGLKINFIPF